MKQKFKFKGITYSGKVKHKIIELECPKFSVIPGSVFHGYKLPDTTIESQQIDWLDSIDKRDLMDEHDFSILIDYWVAKPKVKKPTVIDLLKTLDLDEKMLLDLIAVYSKIKPDIKSKSAVEQIKILFSHLRIGYQAIIESYASLDRCMNEYREEKRKQTEHLLE